MDHDDLGMEEEPRGYALSGKIMLSAIIILFGVVIFMVGLHLYARWYLLRTRRRELIRRRNRVNRRAHIVFYVDNQLSGSAGVVNRGLEPAVLNSLPVSVYSSKNRSEAVECAVCLSEFEDGDKGRLLPKCNHSFHIECIDMWFHSHSTCPLCRSAVEPFQESVKNLPETAVFGGEPVMVQAEPGSSSGLCVTCQHGEGNDSNQTTSLGSRRKALDLSSVRIEVPRRTELENGLELSSPASYSFRSPGTRLLSLKRILSMSRKSPVGVGAGTSLAGSSETVSDLESGLTQGQTR